MIGINQDITEEKNLQERMRIMEKMDAIGKLSGGIAHDFNNQLTGILGYASVLQTTLESPDHLLTVDRIMTAVERSSDLTRRLLSFARKTSPRTVSVDLHDIIHEVIEILKHSIDKRIEIVQQLNATMSRIDGDPTLLQSARLNLAMNSCDAMPNGGRLSFRTEVLLIDEDTPKPLLFRAPVGHCISIIVSDNGIGIPDENKNKIFDPFFTTKSIGNGVGLGLSVVSGTVQSHNGAINLKTKVGVGTEISLLFPKGRLSPKSKSTPKKTSPHKKQGTILVIDDEEPIRITLSFLLRKEGYNVITAADGYEGIEAFQASAETIDLIILDLNMPRMSGRDVFTRIKKINPNASVLISSGYSSDNIEDLNKLGLSGFISKPYQKDELMIMIEQILEL